MITHLQAWEWLVRSGHRLVTDSQCLLEIWRVGISDLYRKNSNRFQFRLFSINCLISPLICPLPPRHTQRVKPGFENLFVRVSNNLCDTFFFFSSGPFFHFLDVQAFMDLITVTWLNDSFMVSQNTSSVQSLNSKSLFCLCCSWSCLPCWSCR